MRNSRLSIFVSRLMGLGALLACLSSCGVVASPGMTTNGAGLALAPVPTLAVPAPIPVNTGAPWSVFHDPVYGYALSYPASWLRFTENDGSHLTLYNPLTGTTINPIITTQSDSPTVLLQQELHEANTSQISLAGLPAADTFTPYQPEPPEDDTINIPASGGPLRVELATLPVANLVGTTTIYSFRLTQPTDLQGHITSAEADDLHDFTSILKSLILPVEIHSFEQPVGPCGRVCWADANWNYNSYDDTSSLYCTNPAWYFAEYSPNAYCGNQAGTYVGAYNVHGIQVPASQTGDWQPDFQCADFVSRALSQDGLMPGLNNGGIYGLSPASPTVGGYDSYQGADGNVYRLWNVGIPGIPGLSDYLLNNRLATDIHANIDQARPGDVVFFIDQNGLYYHAMIITSLGNGYLVLNGHNAAQYHLVIKATDFKMDIYHIRS